MDHPKQRRHVHVRQFPDSPFAVGLQLRHQVGAEDVAPPDLFLDQSGHVLAVDLADEELRLHPGGGAEGGFAGKIEGDGIGPR